MQWSVGWVDTIFRSNALSAGLALGPLLPILDLGPDPSMSLEVTMSEGSSFPAGRGGPKQRAAGLGLGER